MADSRPKIEEMLRLSLSEEIDELADEAELDQDVANMEEMGGQYHEDGMEESADINEAELEEILAQLEANKKKPREKSKWQERLEQMQETQKKVQSMQDKVKKK
jgi:hypothetical protein